MKKTTRTLLSAIVFTLIVLVTILGFLILNFEKTLINYLGLIFLVISELSFPISLFLLSKTKTETNRAFITSGTISADFLYFVATLILIVLSNLFIYQIGNYLFIEFILLIVFVLIQVLFFVFSEKINASESKIINGRAVIQLCENKTYQLLCNAKYEKYKQQINDIYESIRYSANSGAFETDEKILSQIITLEKSLESDKASEQDFQDVKSLILMRNMELSKRGKGGF